MKLGICGSIGSGKSYICNLFADLGIPVYDTDKETKKFIYDPIVLDKVRNYFGEDIFEDNDLNRKSLAKIIFDDDKKLKWIQTLLYPYLLKDIDNWYNKQDSKYVIIESAIFYETGYDELIDKMLVVVAPDDVRMNRVMNRDNVPKEHFDLIESRQMSQSEKMFRADYVIQNHNMEVVKLVDKIHSELMRML